MNASFAVRPPWQAVPVELGRAQEGCLGIRSLSPTTFTVV